MDATLKTAIGVIIPFLGTALGASVVLLIKRGIKPGLQKLLLGFASGVMIAASVWSLIIPSIKMAEEQGGVPWLPSAVGFTAGMVFLLLMDAIVPHLHAGSKSPEGVKSGFGKNTMLILAVTLHNLPEGMAVGIVFAGFLFGGAGITFAAALSLSIGIALQNIPEGAIISLPLAGDGLKRNRAFLYGILSGAVEPLGALITITLTNFIMPIIPYLLSFAAGAMIYVATDELIPEAQSGEHSTLATIGVGCGFVIMMVMDVALG